MTEPIVDFTPTTRRIKALLEHVRDDQLDAPTPCDEYAVGDLLHHIAGLTVAFTRAADKSPASPDDPSTGPDDVSAAKLDPRWRSRLPAQLDALAAAWAAPSAWEGEATAGGVTAPAAELGMVAAEELIVHGWDLARAADAPYDADPRTLEAVAAMLSQWPEAGVEGAFAARVPVADDAPMLERAVGLTGRDPAWKP
ncbi:MAG: TIGR03086 family metal-binding protein [Stackebrandtia sp.]